MTFPQPLSLSASTRHRALACYDILCKVFDHLAASEETWYDYDAPTGEAHAWHCHRADSVRKSTLARCARVCKAFFVPATSVLWRDVDNFSPLVSLMRVPRSSTNVARSSESDARTIYYSRRIRSVHGLGKPLSSNEEKFLQSFLEKGVGVQPLFPQLRHLRWIHSIPFGVALPQVTPPTLKSLHIIFHRSPTVDTPHCEGFVRNLLQELAKRAPHLRYLRTSTSGDIFRESWLDSIGCFSDLATVDFLERVYCEVTTSPLLRPLSSLQGLRNLKIRLPSEVAFGAGRSAFPSLQALTLDAMFAPLSAVSDFLSLISSPHLHSLVVQNCECTTTAVGTTLYEVCGVVQTRFSTSLRRLDISLRGIGPLIAGTPPLINTIEPLLELHDLDDVRISITPEVAVVPASEHDLAKMAEAWPKATRLHLCYSPSTASPSLKDVEGFAYHCSGLTDLVLPGIDASVSDVDSEELIPTRLGHDVKGAHRLRSLCLSDGGWHSRIPDPSRLARFLDTLFPEVDWKCPPLASEHWRETIQEVVSLRVTRMLRA